MIVENPEDEENINNLGLNEIKGVEEIDGNEALKVENEIQANEENQGKIGEGENLKGNLLFILTPKQIKY